MNSQTENHVSLKPTERRGGRRGREGVGLKLNLQFSLKISERTAMSAPVVCAMKIIALEVKTWKGIGSKLLVQQTLFIRCSSLVCCESAWHTSITRDEYSPLRCWQSSDSSVERQPKEAVMFLHSNGASWITSTDRVTDVFTEVPKAPMVVELNTHAPLSLIYIHTRLGHLQRWQSVFLTLY